jgi:hypothetical protein
MISTNLQIRRLRVSFSVHLSTIASNTGQLLVNLTSLGTNFI